MILYSRKSEDIINKQKPIDNQILQRVKNNLNKKGVDLLQSEEVDRYLVFRGIEATVFDPGDIIFMHSKVSASGFFEELIHYGQVKRGGFNKDSPEDIFIKEIEAQKRLIKYRNAYQITDEEIEVLTGNLNYYKIKLEILRKGGV